MSGTTVVIADRHPVVRQGLSSPLGADSDFRIVASCGDGASCMEALRNLARDIAIIGVSLPGLTGPEVLSIANSANGSTRLVFFTASDEESELVMSATAERYSVISKDAAPELLLQSLRRVAAGQRLLPPSSADQTLSPEQSTIPENNALDVLTDRERQIMRLVSEGLSNKEIGRRLNITDGTIKVHLHNIFQKLEINNRTVLATLAIAREEASSALLENESPRGRRG